jgi:hypothetical protein
MELNVMNCKEIKNILDKNHIKQEVELKKVFKIYNMYLEHCNDFKRFEAILKNNSNNEDKYLNWASKINFIRENYIKSSKDQFAKDLSDEIKRYLQITDNSFDFLDRINKTPKGQFDRNYGFKTALSIRQSLKIVTINSKEDVIKQNKSESKFIENFCNIYNISYDWFMKKMYKNFQELELVAENEIRPIIKEFGYEINQIEKNKILSIINNSINTIDKEIEKVLNDQKSSYSDEFLIILLLNLFEKSSTEKSSIIYTQFLETLLNFVNTFENKLTKEEYIKEVILTKAKLLSNIEKDEEALKLLEESNNNYKDKQLIDFINIKAASYKRMAFKNENENDLESSCKLYIKSFEIKSNYYSLINILYILKILDKKDFDEYAEKWKNLKSENNWWYFISNLEYLMLVYDDKQNLEKEFKNIPDIKSISRFEIDAVFRQLKYFEKFAKKSVIETESFNFLKNEIKKIKKNPNLGIESHLMN